MPVQCTCLSCGKTFSTIPSRVATARYCSPECGFAGRTKHAEKPCAHCGELVSRPPSMFRGRVFCGNECARAGRYPPIEQRFWANVDKNGPVPAHCSELGPCWIWTAFRHPKGYGQFEFNGRPRGAHIFAYTITYGPPSPDKPWVLHSCDGGSIGCVRPSHLYAGTPAGNNEEMVSKGRQAKGSRVRGARLTDEAVREIRQRYADGCASQRALASEYGVSQPAISAILRGVTWRQSR